MSDLVFPALPGLQIGVSRTPRYATQVHEAVSGKQVRVSWRSRPKITFGLRVTVRDGVQAPSPFSAISEMAVLEKFLDDHKGALDSFLFHDPRLVALNNGTKVEALYTGNPVNGTQVRVHLVEDSLRTVEVVEGWWAVESLELETVL